MIGKLRTLAHAAVLAVALLITACVSTRTCELDRTQWKLVAWKGESLELQNAPIRLVFSEGRLSGFGGINGYDGAYKAMLGGRFCAGSRCGGAPEDAGTVDALASTNPEGKADRIEGLYINLSFGAVGCKVRGDTLTFYDSLGTETLTFARD